MTAAPQGLAAPPPRQPGRVGRALIRMLMRHAHVVAVESVADRFRLMTLEGPGFKGLSWVPGQKVQVAMGSAFVARTFTPIEWDASSGRTRLLGYAHGSGPGSAWISGARPGDECDVFGPRASLDASRVGGQCVVLGDETSIGLAGALSRQLPGGALRCLIEANDVADSRQALTRLEIADVELFERTGHDAHLDEIERRLPALAAAGASFVMTGKATSIQRQRRVLIGLGVPAGRLLVKPYWAPGKTGLD